MLPYGIQNMSYSEVKDFLIEVAKHKQRIEDTDMDYFKNARWQRFNNIQIMLYTRLKEIKGENIK